MNRSFWIYGLVLSMGLASNGFCLSTISAARPYTQTLIDSIPSDSASIAPRQFEDLKEKYSDEAFIYERSAQNSGWWTRFKQWLSDVFRDLFNLSDAGQASKATDLALKIAGIIIFLLVIYFIFKAVMNNEGTWVFGKSSDRNTIQVTDLESNLQDTDFKQLIAAAEEQGHYRLAIRYYYLWLLKSLAHAELIDYDVEKTNSDYCNEITSQAIKTEFSYTSYLYNYIWYGEFDVDQQQFSKAKAAFVNFLNSLST